jgi:hypothetical protein
MHTCLACLPGDVLSLVAVMLMPADRCDSYACDALRAMCASCRALRAFFAETCLAYIGTYVHVDSPSACASAHRMGLVFDPRALSARVARDFGLFPSMRSLVVSTKVEGMPSGTALVDPTSVALYSSLLLRCAGLDESAQWTRRVTEMSVEGSWLGTCAEIASFVNLRSLTLVQCRCHTVAGLDALDLESLAIDALSFYSGRRGGRYVGPVPVGPEFLAPILRVRKLFVRRTPVLSSVFAFLSGALT